MDNLVRAEQGEMPTSLTSEPVQEPAPKPLSPFSRFTGQRDPLRPSILRKNIFKILQSKVSTLSRFVTFNNSEGKAAPIVDTENAVKPALFGWRALSTIQAGGSNTAMFRKPDDVTQRIIIDQQIKMWALTEKLRAEDEKDAQQSPDRLKSFGFDPEHLIQRYSGDIQSQGCSHCVSTESATGRYQERYRKDRIMEALFAQSKSFYEYIDVLCRIEALPKVGRRSYDNRVGLMGSQLPRDSDEWRAVFEDGHEFLTTQTHGPFERLILHEKLPVIRKLFIWLFSRKDVAIADPENDYLSSEAVDTVERAVISTFCCGILIAPMAILLLVELSGAASLAVIVAFSALFVMSLSVTGVKLDGQLLALCAYVAISATFVANLN
ncbi:hypothetical protein AB5N19_13534 [Seiridium cardinale]